MKIRKIYWATCQKQLKSTKLDKSVIIKHNTSEEKTKGDDIYNPMLWVNFKICNVNLAYYTLNK